MVHNISKKEVYNWLLKRKKDRRVALSRMTKFELVEMAREQGFFKEKKDKHVKEDKPVEVKEDKPVEVKEDKPVEVKEDKFVEKLRRIKANKKNVEKLGEIIEKTKNEDRKRKLIEVRMRLNKILELQDAIRENIKKNGKLDMKGAVLMRRLKDLTK